MNSVGYDRTLFYKTGTQAGKARLAKVFQEAVELKACLPEQGPCLLACACHGGKAQGPGAIHRIEKMEHHTGPA